MKEKLGHEKPGLSVGFEPLKLYYMMNTKATVTAHNSSSLHDFRDTIPLLAQTSDRLAFLS